MSVDTVEGCLEACSADAACKSISFYSFKRECMVSSDDSSGDHFEKPCDPQGNMVYFSEKGDARTNRSCLKDVVCT